MAPVDYATTGMDLQSAMLDRHKRYPDKSLRPDHVLWNAMRVKTYDWWTVPRRGRIRIELIEANGTIEQAADVKIENGSLMLVGGTEVRLLRTWADSRYEDTVEYPYFSKTGRLCVNNAYRRISPDGRATEEKWTGNAGFWVEELSPLDRIYHCSHGAVPTPDFLLFTFRVTVSAAC